MTLPLGEGTTYATGERGSTEWQLSALRSFMDAVIGPQLPPSRLLGFMASAKASFQGINDCLVGRSVCNRVLEMPQNELPPYLREFLDDVIVLFEQSFF